MRIMHILIKETDVDTKIEYIFDIFTKYNKNKVIYKQQILEVVQIFGNKTNIEG
jgi:hypothetical protein